MTLNDDLNKLNIIINDSNCMDSFINKICKALESEGLKVKKTKDSMDIEDENACIITLDQQTNSGSGIVLFGPYNNNIKNDKSDALLLCFKAAFENYKYSVDNVVCGIREYKEDNSKNVTTRTPSDTEENIAESSSFVGVALGTDAYDAKLVGKAIINALNRFNNYLKKNDSNKYIYRGTEKINMDKLEEIFGVDSESINKMNGFSYDNNVINIDYAYISPKVKEILEFSKDYDII